MLLCPRCEATVQLEKAGYKKPKVKYAHRWRYRAGHHKGERIMFNKDHSRGGLIHQIDRNNSPLFQLVYFENGEKIGYEIFTCRESAQYHRTAFLNYRKTRGNKKSMKVVADNGRTKVHSQKQLDYIRKFNDNTYRQFNLKLNKATDNDIIEALDSSPNKIDLIRSWYFAYVNQK